MKGTLSGLVRFAEPVIRRLLHLYWRFARGCDTWRARSGARRARPRLPGQAFLRLRLASAGRRGGGRRDDAGGTDARTARGGQYRGRGRRRVCSRSISTPGSPGATMSRCLWWRISRNRRRRVAMPRSSITASFRRRPCRRIPPPRPAPGSPKCWRGRPFRSIGNARMDAPARGCYGAGHMTDLSITILPETADDEIPIERLHERTFGPGRYARTAFRIREGVSHLFALSFTARIGTLLVGSVRLSPCGSARPKPCCWADDDVADRAPARAHLRSRPLCAHGLPHPRGREPSPRAVVHRAHRHAAGRLGAAVAGPDRRDQRPCCSAR